MISVSSPVRILSDPPTWCLRMVRIVRSARQRPAHFVAAPHRKDARRSPIIRFCPGLRQYRSFGVAPMIISLARPVRMMSLPPTKVSVDHHTIQVSTDHCRHSSRRRRSPEGSGSTASLCAAVSPHIAQCYRCRNRQGSDQHQSRYDGVIATRGSHQGCRIYPAR